jgi:hypothetical protein
LNKKIEQHREFSTFSLNFLDILSVFFYLLLPLTNSPSTLPANGSSTSNNNVNNEAAPPVDMNANEKSSAHQSQNPSSTAPGNPPNPTNGAPPKAQRDRGNRGGAHAGGIRNKKPMNSSGEPKPSEKLVNGSS